ncbi:protein RoBo-1-like isoform X2 [Silurus meridionalis]|uniref:protein RoBo-1-like isoform X2 n=1 Tax=Silurus meridionalis TaxID=175797 RepID=UPI001EEB3BB3|nr:protein RoBo-1-like isoform X2 [Silurus meridionalis]
MPSFCTSTLQSIITKLDIVFYLIHFQNFSNLTTMKLQLVLLLLICMPVSDVLSITCQECISFGVTSCTSTQVNCSDQCATASVSLYTGTTQVINVSMQTCSRPNMCFNGSLNTGTMNIINYGKCCSTDLCNNETLPGPPQSPNGLLCYTCDPHGCSRTLNCMGDQNLCISTTGYLEVQQMSCEKVFGLIHFSRGHTDVHQPCT